MLEGTVARILNQLLGKYVVDLDTENLNVGIFSGKVQLTDLKLKPEALYELNLPIEVKTGTIGKICLQIPWNALWTKSIDVNIEDVHLVVNPVVRNEAFDTENNKKLVRAFKKAILERLENTSDILGGPTAFADHLISYILSYIQLNITTIHIRYEDSCSYESALSAGLCIGAITAQTTNSKWRRTSYDPFSDNVYYQIKLEAVSVYWNNEVTLKNWDMPSQYYQWRNSMVKSMENYCFDGENFKFVLNPTTTKIRLTMNKSKSGEIFNIDSDIIVQDCNLQLSKSQYDSINSVCDNFHRMLTAWQFLENRPTEKILENQKVWWKYAYWATLEQRIRPMTWCKIKKTRENYKKYLETYKKIIENPHDTELKLDLQQHEDNLGIVNVIIARQHTRLLTKSSSLTEKSFWSLLPSPEKTVLCEKIGYSDDKEIDCHHIEHTYNFKLGNFNLTLSTDKKEVLTATVTQTILVYKPSFDRSSYTISLKIEGLIIEGNGPGNSLTQILSSEHLKDSPAFFFKLNLEKLPKNHNFSHRLQVALDSIEFIYNKQAFEELESFLHTSKRIERKNLLNHLKTVPDIFYDWVAKKLENKWDLHLNIKCPYFVVPESSSCLVSENLLVIDMGRFTIKTEICQQTKISENATQMELEEQLYSKLFVDCREFQILFCDKNDHWKDARREKDTAMHLVPKTGFSSVYAVSVLELPTIPSMKFNINFNSLKLNVSEKKMFVILKFFDIDQIRINIISDAMQPNIYITDTIREVRGIRNFRNIQKSITICDTLKYRKHKMMNGGRESNLTNGFLDTKDSKSNNMNEMWARTVDLPGLEDNISPKNTIQTLYGIVLNEFSIIFSKSSNSSDRQYLMLRLGQFTMDVAFMTYGPAYQLSIHSVLLTDKLHTTPSGQYLDLIYTPLPTSQDVVTVLYRKVKANCPDFWTHFHGVETSLVANLGNIYLLLHQEAIHTLIKYSKYLSKKMQSQTSQALKRLLLGSFARINEILHKPSDVPVPPGSVKFSQSARMSELNVNVCDSDFDIINVQICGLEMDTLFRANERFVFRSFLSSINVDHMSPLTLYTKVLYTDEDKVFEVKYVRNAAHLSTNEIILKENNEKLDGAFKFQLGRIHFIVLYKLMVQLKRFVVNLETLELLEKFAQLIETTVKTATDTLKNKTKISLAINVCGPVLLIPQKSSSPNVIVMDTGNLKIENFFKENETEVVENILLKVNETVVTRGVMTLQSTIEMQETLVEPLCLTMDIKKCTNLKSAQKTWDIDSNLDKVEVTLGQKDLSMIMSIYTDNIGEANIVDFLPEQMRSPSILSEIFEQDDSVRDLEVFFCEPKQKFLSAKCRVDEVKLLFFFDAGELLSSPIRDLNHGLCKFEINDIDSSILIYTDESCDGKLSIDKLRIEEIGPDANVHNKIVLGAPAEDGRNNNLCNITVNKPPIVDITFHQNKNGDKSADIIIGRLCLSLSIPFCEKVALYVLECIPKDIQETGIINLGYEGDTTHHTDNKKAVSNSLTISIRVNKPEIMFLVETTSNRKRYFITKTEIIIDFSNHGTRTNLVTSLSGLHSLFYDLNEYSDESYTILRHCDIELSRNIEENSEKVNLAISGVYINLCSEVVHSINDILNDIIEHFKLPEMEMDKIHKLTIKQEKTTKDQEELWEPKKMDPYINKQEIRAQLPTSDVKTFMQQILTIPKFEVVLILELEHVQVLLLRATLEFALHDWNHLLHCNSELSLQVNYFNEHVQNWEPLVEPVTCEEQQYRPWECQIKIFQDKSQPINDIHEQKNHNKSPGSSISKTQKASRSYTTTEDEDSGEDMMYLEPVNSTSFSNNRRVKTSLSTFLEDSDSETDEGAMEKLAAAITDLFTGDWNEKEDSEIENSSDEENDITALSSKPKEQREISEGKCLYVLINSKDPLNLTVTPDFLKIFNELIAQYTYKIVYCVPQNILVLNDIGPHTRVELYEKTSENKEDILVALRKFEKDDSVPNSPTRNIILTEVSFEDNHFMEEKQDIEQAYDFNTVRSLNFLPDSTAELYDKMNKHYVKVYVPNFTPIQTNCSKRNWEKLVRLPSKDSQEQNYFLALQHKLGREGRTITVASPLQIKNETCFALNILYQPSILQQLNLEPIGEVTNPFETTMRIAILEPQEKYSVPLHVAYNCKIFVQPAYAEGHYASETGIWWKEMAAELDTSYNLICRPKTDHTPEIFALKVALSRNVRTTNSLVHSVPNYIITLLPPMTVHNFLPYTLIVESQESTQPIQIEPSEKCSLYNLDLSQDQKLLLKITYNNLTWTGHVTVTGHLDEKITLMTSQEKDESENLSVNVKCDREAGCHLIIYTPYWIVNKTGLPLKIKASSSHNTTHVCPNDDILLFTYKRHCKQTLNVKVYESNWSNEFGVECAGTTGLVVCKDGERKKKYLFFLNIKLSNFCPRLTKIVTILPSFLVTNNTEKPLRFMENNEKTDLWIDLEPQKTLIFWPETSSMQIYVKYRESKLISQAFFISCHHKTVLRMDKGSALTVEVTEGQNGPFKIEFNDFQDGDAPVWIQNYCADLFLKIQQQDQSPVTLMSPNQSLTYTWDDPTRPRQLVWNVYNNKGNGFFLDITKDGYGEEKIKSHSVTPTNTSEPQSSSSEDSDSSSDTQTNLNKRVRKDKIVIYWACYVQGPQRMLLFTQEQRIFENLLNTHFHEQSGLEMILSINEISLSVFTSEEDKKEHIFVSVNDFPATWEVNVGHKWKTLTLELASWIEDKYKRCGTYKKCQIKDFVHIDFEKMFMIKPFFAEIRRTYSPAVFCQFRKSSTLQNFTFQIQNCQIDNSHSGCIAFQPSLTNLNKNLEQQGPFFKIRMSKQVEANFTTYRYVDIKMTDVILNVENDLWIKIGELMRLNKKFGENYSISASYINDITSIRKTISNFKQNQIPKNQSRIERLNLSSFGMQLNISNRAQMTLTGEGTSLSRVLNHLFPYNMAPYMPMEGVHHKITSTEWVDLNQIELKQVIENLGEQLGCQFLQQYYSQVLGLQVLVNTFAIQPGIEIGQFGTEKNSETISYGCKCILGHIAMSSAAWEACIQDIFPNVQLDHLITQKSWRHTHGASGILPKIVASSSKNINIGVPCALAQLFVKNHNAMTTCDGEIFFKTTGKALLSLLTRHPDEKTDSVNLAREALRRATILGEPIKIHQRLTRYRNNIMGLTPFSIHDSIGQYILETLANCRYSNDTYWNHTALDKNGKTLILVSLEHVFRINKFSLWGPYELEWFVELDNIISLPKINCVELILNLRQNESPSFKEYQIKIAGPRDVLVWLHEKIEQAIILSLEEKSWPLEEI